MDAAQPTDRLEPLAETADCALHAIVGAEAGTVARFLVSTPETREVCNRSELVGIDYTQRMRAGLGRVVACLASQGVLPAEPEAQLCVLHFLRGGLNFGLREALHTGLGARRHGSAFLSSQRVEQDGRWTIREDSYRKLTIPDGAVLVCGDVVATGATLQHGLQIVLEHLRATGTKLRKLVLFTIGCERAEQIVADLEAPLRELSPAYEGSAVVYLEGRFRLADADTGLRIVEPGTDLLRKGALLAPAFAASQRESIAYPLERCAIYDAGSRAFDIPAYLADVRRYWTQVARFAEEGWTLTEALAERWDVVDPPAWTVPRDLPLDSSAALAAVVAGRLEALV